ncbi:ATP synthase protein, subunit I [Fulvimarina pelagi HTCC2506]|uniref:ATP synthase protein, subunit I n=1 Tax=Fulvimarina pelagi HTCC2506 TaxID=314231 RepID=Q0G568_9HYPH|nr:AtpZ/AtpI family protein [Fulvimarina pelagi]EAU43196.1 ATP synthase protein, subunit I [Fulvimarina pelagi HTCC2506]
MSPANEDDSKSNHETGYEPPATKRTPEEWAERRSALEAKLAARNATRELEAKRSSGSGSSMKGIAEGLKLASEFAAGIIVGGGIGFVIDKYAGTSPFGLIVFLMFGFAAGIRNVLRSVGPKPANPLEGRENSGRPPENAKDS